MKKPQNSFFDAELWNSKPQPAEDHENITK